MGVRPSRPGRHLGSTSPRHLGPFLGRGLSACLPLASESLPEETEGERRLARVDPEKPLCPGATTLARRLTLADLVCDHVGVVGRQVAVAAVLAALEPAAHAAVDEVEAERVAGARVHDGVDHGCGGGRRGGARKNAGRAGHPGGGRRGHASHSGHSGLVLRVRQGGEGSGAGVRVGSGREELAAAPPGTPAAPAKLLRVLLGTCIGCAKSHADAPAPAFITAIGGLATALPGMSIGLAMRTARGGGAEDERAGGGARAGGRVVACSVGKRALHRKSGRVAFLDGLEGLRRQLALSHLVRNGLRVGLFQVAVPARIAAVEPAASAKIRVLEADCARGTGGSVSESTKRWAPPRVSRAYSGRPGCLRAVRGCLW
eukprot:gene1481-biopygen10789